MEDLALLERLENLARLEHLSRTEGPAPTYTHVVAGPSAADGRERQ